MRPPGFPHPPRLCPPLSGYDEEARYFESGVSSAKRQELEDALHALARRVSALWGLCVCVRACVCVHVCVIRGAALLTARGGRRPRPRARPACALPPAYCCRPAFESQLALLSELSLMAYQQSLQQAPDDASFVDQAAR